MLHRIPDHVTNGEWLKKKSILCAYENATLQGQEVLLPEVVFCYKQVK